MSKNITIIPPSESRPKTLRVAAYCRVSTDMEEQASSYASQIRSYTELIRANTPPSTPCPSCRCAGSAARRTSGVYLRQLPQPGHSGEAAPRLIAVMGAEGD